MARRLRHPRSLVAAAACAALVGPAGEPAASAAPAAAKTLDYAQAQRFMLSLINRDRKKAGLPPVELDEAASKAGLRHARDMAKHGFTGHVGSDGSVPEQRYTESGGSHFVRENAACLFDRVERKPDEEPRFDPVKLAALHKMFMDEVPPNDGHRRNVLAPLHNRVGIGLAQPENVAQPCLAQEFVDKYGDFEPLPREARRGAALRASGTVAKPLVFGGVGIGRTPLPRPVPRERLNGGTYRIPTPDTMYFPSGFKTPKPVEVDGQRFSIDLVLGKAAGTYAISVWAKQPGSEALFMISLRTVTVR
jgi:uncharacterized protein YkwD